MQHETNQLIRECYTCQTTKSHHTSDALYTPLPIPLRPWKNISMDFITNLDKTSKGNNSILEVVNRFSKMAHFVPCKKAIDAAKIATLFFQPIFHPHGIPCIIVSDCGVHFTSRFWNTLWKLLSCNMKLSTTIHPQTHGQTVDVNCSFGDMLVV